jgi:hypothetical protein
MVGIAPAFYYHNQVPALSVPNEAIETVLDAARRYDVAYLVLDENHPVPLRAIYTGERDHSQVQFIKAYDGVRLYRLLLN